jgi:hypothetical protein
VLRAATSARASTVSLWVAVSLITLILSFIRFTQDRPGMPSPVPDLGGDAGSECYDVIPVGFLANELRVTRGTCSRGVTVISIGSIGKCLP